jgi:glutaredoxin
MPWPGNWLRRPGASGPRQVVLYARSGCHLCADARRLLAEQQSKIGFSLTIVDVDTDPALAKRYGDRVPVVVVSGKVRFHGRINLALFERLFRNS